MIFGTGVPRIHNLDLSIVLDFTGINYKMSNPKIKYDRQVNQSIFTGEKHVHLDGKHYSFEINIFGGVDREMVLDLESLIDQTVWFYPHWENSHRRLKCYLVKADPYYYKELEFKDSIILELETIEYFKDTANTIRDEDSGEYPFVSGHDQYFTDSSDTKYTDEDAENYIMTGGEDE